MQQAEARRGEHKPVGPARAVELQGTEWVLGFFERYPLLKTLQAGAEDRFLAGAIDVHVHASPDTLGPRSQGIVDVAADAARAGMKAILQKDHYHSTVGVAHVAQRYVDALVENGRLPRRVEVYGGVPLAFTTDPRVVEVTLHSPYMKMLFFNCVYGEMLLERGRVRPPVLEIIRLAAAHKIPVTLCPPNHSVKQQIDDFEGTLPLVEAVAETGGKALLDHPVTSFTMEQIQRLVSYGAYVGVFCYPAIPTVSKAPVTDPDLIYTMIKTVGPEHCVIGSDMGHVLEPDAVAALRLLIRLLLAFGLGEEQVAAMCRTNPDRLLFG